MLVTLRRLGKENFRGDCFNAGRIVKLRVFWKPWGKKPMPVLARDEMLEGVGCSENTVQFSARNFTE